MKIIHYTDGYGGKYNYKTYCGKELHSHSETEGTTLQPSKVTCDACKEQKDFLIDLENETVTPVGIKRRIFIESDIGHANAIRSAQRNASDCCEERGAKYIRRVFNEILDYAWHDLEKTWQAVKKADEIYADSSLMPLSGGIYIGAPVIFNGMCERAIKENITGKDVYIFRQADDISWRMIDLKLMQKAFSGNKLFFYNDKYNMVEVDVKMLIRGIKK